MLKLLPVLCCLGFFAVLMAGCATSNEYSTRLSGLEASVPVCKGERGCDAKWKAARAWVARNSHWIIVLDSEDFIETARDRDSVIPWA
jgi:hypothetical protein